MKKIKLLVYALIVCMSFVSMAEAKSRGGSFKSGFSSQKRSPAKPASTYTAAPANEQTKKTAFGSFGTANQKVQQNATAPQSQMSKDLNGAAAQSNALKTADARTKTNDTTTASDSGWFRSGSQNSGPQKAQTATNGTTMNSNRDTASGRSSGQQGNGLLYGLMGFMIGNSIAQHAGAANASQQNQATNVDTNQGSEQGIDQLNNPITADGFAAQQIQDVPAEETESFFMKLVRVFLWVAMLGGVIGVVRKIMSFRNRKLNRTTHYSLGS